MAAGEAAFYAVNPFQLLELGLGAPEAAGAEGGGFEVGLFTGSCRRFGVVHLTKGFGAFVLVGGLCGGIGEGKKEEDGEYVEEALQHGFGLCDLDV